MIEIKEEHIGHYFQTGDGVIVIVEDIVFSDNYPVKLLDGRNMRFWRSCTINGRHALSQASACDVIKYIGPNYSQESEKNKVKTDEKEINMTDNLITQERVGHYFKSREGEIFKLIHLLNPKKIFHVVFASLDNSRIFMTILSGYYRPDGIKDDMDIVEYIGQKPEESLREVKFEAYLGENPDGKKLNVYPEDRQAEAMEVAFGYGLSMLFTDKTKMGYYWNKISKWKITMQEIKE